MQKKVLLSSVLVIALCLSVIAGTTFALFTDEAKVNTVITSGDVEVTANLDIIGVFSAKALADQKNGRAEDKFLIDENKQKYEHVNPQKGDYVFTNGGEAYLDAAKSTLTIDRITPGDRVDVKITIKNAGDVDMMYRYNIEAVDEGLASGMVITADEKAYEGAVNFTSAWSEVIAVGQSRERTLSFELPVYAGNEYQSEDDVNAKYPGEKGVTYTITVEAVQGNAATTNNAEPVTLTGDYNGNNETLNFAGDPAGNFGISTNGSNISNVTIMGNTATATDKNGNPVNKGFRAIYVAGAVTDDININDVVASGTYAINVNSSVAGNANFGLYANDSVFNGWASYESLKEAVFTNCAFGKAEGYANLRPYINTTLVNCDFAAGYTITASTANAFTITLENCTVNGDVVTAANFQSLLDTASEYKLADANVTVVVDGVTVVFN